MIDLIHRDGDAWAITDYKTDVDASLEAKSVYAMQLVPYKRALVACGVAVSGVNIAPVRRSV